MTRQLAKDLQQLSKSNPVPGEDKFKRRITRLERIIGFYQEKKKDSPTRQAFLFQSFIAALKYSIDINRAYRRLTINLKELAESSDNDIVNVEKIKEK
jgi:hypothetical protein